MMAALLESMLDERLDVGVVQIDTSGFGPVGLPPIDEAVAAMERRGLDVSAHRSSPTTASVVEDADLILTAERDHVVKIAALSPGAFRRALTLPEFLDACADGRGGGAGDNDLRSWAASLTEGRTAGSYLRAVVPDVADPTGSSPRAFELAVAAIEQRCREAAAHIAVQLTRPRDSEHVDP
jgi:protein-tyrosine phosphatase